MPGVLDFVMGGATPLVEAVGKIATDLITTDKERLQLALQDKQLDMQGDMAQIEVNKTEAASGLLFVSGGRPAIIWVGAIALFCAYVPKCLMLTGIWSYQAIVLVSMWKAGTAMPSLPAFPDLSITDLMGLLGALLGTGYMRHKEKIAGVAASAFGDSPPPPNPAQQEAP